MLKLTRLNHQEVAINPDHISWVDSNPDTTLFLIGGEKILVRESVDELIERIVEFRRLIGRPGESGPIGDPPRFGGPPPRRASSEFSARHASTQSRAATRISTPPQKEG